MGHMVVKVEFSYKESLKLEKARRPRFGPAEVLLQTEAIGVDIQKFVGRAQRPT